MSETRQNTKQENEQNRKEVLKNERSILSGLRKARQMTDAEELTQEIHINDMATGEELFSFTIRPLKETEYEKARENARARRANALGERPVDESRFRNGIIYAATIDKDKAEIWDNKENLYEFGTNDPLDIIEDVLPAGYKAKVTNLIDRISGYGLDQEIVNGDELKNS